MTKWQGDSEVSEPGKSQQGMIRSREPSSYCGQEVRLAQEIHGHPEIFVQEAKLLHVCSADDAKVEQAPACLLTRSVRVSHELLAAAGQCGLRFNGG